MRSYWYTLVNANKCWQTLWKCEQATGQTDSLNEHLRETLWPWKLWKRQQLVLRCTAELWPVTSIMWPALSVLRVWERGCKGLQRYAKDSMVDIVLTCIFCWFLCYFSSFLWRFCLQVTSLPQLSCKTSAWNLRKDILSNQMLWVRAIIHAFHIDTYWHDIRRHQPRVPIRCPTLGTFSQPRCGASSSPMKQAQQRWQFRLVRLGCCAVRGNQPRGLPKASAPEPCISWTSDSSSSPKGRSETAAAL